MISHDLLHITQLYEQFSGNSQQKPEILQWTHSINFKGTTVKGTAMIHKKVKSYLYIGVHCVCAVFVHT